MRFVSIIALVVAAAVLTTGGIYLFDYVGEKDVTTTVMIQDGLTCTINGEPVSNGGTVTTNAEKKMCIHIESTGNALLAFSGKWVSEKKTVYKDDALTEAAQTADFCIKLDRQDFTGNLAIFIAGSDSDDICPIHMTFKFDESQAKLTYSGGEIKNGDVITFPKDGYVNIESKLGRANIHYHYYWSNDYCNGSGDWEELNTSINATIDNMAWFSDGTGEFTVSVSPES